MGLHRESFFAMDAGLEIFLLQKSIIQQMDPLSELLPWGNSGQPEMRFFWLILIISVLL